MINYFEVNKSKRATCQRCQQFITDPKRGVEESKSYGHKEYKYYCIKCSGEIIKQAKKELQSLEEVMNFHTKRLEQKV